MTNKTAPITALTCALLLLATACGEAKTTVEAAPTDAAAKTVSLSAADRRARTDASQALEHGLRDWGADPALADREGPADPSIVDEARTPETVADQAFGTGDGPGAAGPECTAFPDSDECVARPTNLAHLRANQWTAGARLDGDPDVALQGDGSAVVSGRVRVILWSGLKADADQAGDGTRWWRFRPATASFLYRDRLEFDKDNAVKARHTLVRPASWLGAPFDADDWTEDATAGMGDADFADIPVSGDMPDLPLTRDAGVAVLTPDMEWTESWTAFMASHGTDLRVPDGLTTQNP